MSRPCTYPCQGTQRLLDDLSTAPPRFDAEVWPPQKWPLPPEDAWWSVCRHQRCLNQKSSRAAHGISQPTPACRIASCHFNCRDSAPRSGVCQTCFVLQAQHISTYGLLKPEIHWVPTPSLSIQKHGWTMENQWNDLLWAPCSVRTLPDCTLIQYT